MSRRSIKMENSESIIIIEPHMSNSEDEDDMKFEAEQLSEDSLKEERKTKEKTKRYERHFKLSWHFDKRFTDWLIRSPNNLPFCKHCGIELKATGGTQDLKHHMKTRKHIRNSSIAKRQETEEPEIKVINQEDFESISSDNDNSIEDHIKFESEELSKDLDSLREDNGTKEETNKYNRHFKLSWNFDKRFSDWLIRSPNNLPYCKHCEIELKATGGLPDLIHHMKTKKHLKNSSFGKLQGTENSEIKKDINQVNNDIKNDLDENYELSIPFEENDVDAKYSKEESSKFYDHCKICDDYIPKTGDNGEVNLDINVLQKLINVEEEKKKIQLEMKLLIDSLDDKTDDSKKLLQSFTDMLISDMSKLPNSAQRKLRMNIMHQVDTELSKIEVT